MSNFEIGLSGLDAAQRALDIIGNNVANAATPGYHRQDIDLAPAYASQTGAQMVGGGVEVNGIRRTIDRLLESEILRQNSLLDHIAQESATLRTIENAFGEFCTDSGLNAAIDEFFNTMGDLAGHPTEIIWQNQAINAAGSLAGQFKALGEFLYALSNQIRLEVDNTVDTINSLVIQIADLNDRIEALETSGKQVVNLRDERDQYISELSTLISVQTQEREYGVVDVVAGGIAVVIGSIPTSLQTGFNSQGKLGVAVPGSYNYNTTIQGGRLGGLLSLTNDIMAGISDDLDDLANAIITEVNKIHVQGLGSDGSFTELTGWPMTEDNFADFQPPITAGELYLRVTNTTDPPTVVRYRIDVPADADSLTSLADYITNNVAGLSASVSSAGLNICADPNYQFDFLPGVLAEPTTNELAADVLVSGIYTGAINQTYTCRVTADGDVGVTDGVQIEVKNGAGDVVRHINIGSGYAAGDNFEIADGIFVSIGMGTLVADQEFTVEALANSDTAGLLSAIGMNTLFRGTGAMDMDISLNILDSPGRLATALGAEFNDNANARLMADIGNTALSQLGNMTAGQFYRQLVTNIGQDLSLKQMRCDNIEAVVQNLNQQQSEISGVNVNDEAAKMLVYEQMYQAMAKYITTIQNAVDSLMQII
jgi:flagellar hook-associated protein 1 FlgK